MRPRRPTMTQPGGEVRKSSSYEPLAGRNDSSSSNEDEASPSGAGRLKSSSMSPLKPHSRSPAKSNPPSDDGQPEIEPGTGAYLKPENEDDVFVDRFPGDYPPEEDAEEQANWPRSPEECRDGQLALTKLDPSDVDAQGIYPPTACIFVANLTQSVRDDRLEAEVTRIFSRFGTVFVKIRRDSRQMPFAFCQFTCDKDADFAVEQGKGIVMFGRACRTEKAKANSVFIVYRKSGGFVSEKDAFRLLDPLGAISDIQNLDEELQREMDIPPAVVVHFKMYDSRRDVLKAVRSQRRFTVIPYEPNKVATPASADGTDTISRVQLAQYEVDRRSAYMGNLPLDMTQEELYEMAISCGRVGKVTLNRKPIIGGTSETVFAFIEFIRPDSVEDLVRTYNASELRGNVIRAQRKQSRSFDGSHHAVFHDSPTPAGRGSSPYPYGEYIPTGPPGRGRYSGSSGRSSRTPMVGSTPVGYGPPMRNSARRAYHTPDQLISHFSDSSRASYYGSYGSPVAGPSTFKPGRRQPWRAAARPIPERNSSIRHRVQTTSPTPPEEESSPKGKGKAPIRPLQLQPTTEAVEDPVSPMSPETANEPKVTLQVSPEHSPETNSEHESEVKHEQKIEHETEREFENKPKGRLEEKSEQSENDKDSGKNEAARLDSKSDDQPETSAEYDADDEEEKPCSPPKAPAAHYAQTHPQPPPPGYAMPYGYMPPQMSPFAQGMPYGMPGPYAPNLHPAILNSYMGYPPGFLWSDPYGNPVYTGMAPGLTGPPPRPAIPDPPPTPTRSGGSQSEKKKQKSAEKPAQGDNEEEKTSPK